MRHGVEVAVRAHVHHALLALQAGGVRARWIHDAVDEQSSSIKWTSSALRNLAGDKGDGARCDGADDQRVRRAADAGRVQTLPAGAAPRVGLLVARLPLPVRPRRPVHPLRAKDRKRHSEQRPLTKALRTRRTCNHLLEAVSPHRGSSVATDKALGCPAGVGTVRAIHSSQGAASHRVTLGSRCDNSMPS